MSMSIRTQPALLGMQTNFGKVNIQSQNAKISFKQNHAKVEIKTELPKVHIDQYECFASAGLKNNRDFIEEQAGKGKQATLKYIAKVSQDGDRKADIHIKAKAVPEIVRRDSYQPKSYGYGVIPKARPKIHVTGSIKFNPLNNGQGIHNGLQTEYTPSRIKFNPIRAKVNIYMRQHPSIQVAYHDDRKLDVRL